VFEADPAAASATPSDAPDPAWPLTPLQVNLLMRQHRGIQGSPTDSHAGRKMTTPKQASQVCWPDAGIVT
jgi:hypothetical protein